MAQENLLTQDIPTLKTYIKAFFDEARMSEKLKGAALQTPLSKLLLAVFIGMSSLLVQGGWRQAGFFLSDAFLLFGLSHCVIKDWKTSLPDTAAFTALSLLLGVALLCMIYLAGMAIHFPSYGWMAPVVPRADSGCDGVDRAQMDVADIHANQRASPIKPQFPTPLTFLLSGLASHSPWRISCLPAGRKPWCWRWRRFKWGWRPRSRFS